jgi:hypothetical protein
MANEPVPQDTPLSAVVAKMTCNIVETRRWSEHQKPSHKVEFGAVCGNVGEDKMFSDATPGGSCWLNISDGRPALNFFKPGKRYYLTFTEAPD